MRLVISPVAVFYCVYYIPFCEQSQTNRTFLYMKFAPKRENPVQVQIIDIAIAGVLGGCPLNKRILLSKCYACGNRFRIAFAIQNLFPPTAEASAPLWWLLVQHAPFLFFFFGSLTEPRGVQYHPKISRPPQSAGLCRLVQTPVFRFCQPNVDLFVSDLILFHNHSVLSCHIQFLNQSVLFSLSY